MPESNKNGESFSAFHFYNPNFESHSSLTQIKRDFAKNRYSDLNQIEVLFESNIRVHFFSRINTLLDSNQNRFNFKILKRAPFHISSLSFHHFSSFKSLFSFNHSNIQIFKNHSSFIQFKLILFKSKLISYLFNHLHPFSLSTSIFIHHHLS